MSDNRKPAHKISKYGLDVAVWRNEGDKGPWYNVTVSNNYKQGDQWKESNSFSEDDLLRLIKMLDEADSWIQRAGQAERKAA